jgi:hypothetical protein
MKGLRYLPLLIVWGILIIVIAGLIWLLFIHAHKAQVQISSPISSSSVKSEVEIVSLSPASGPVGTLVTIHGKGFTPGNNVLFFGTSSGKEYQNGTPANAYASTASANGTTLVFQIPRSSPSGTLCAGATHCAIVTSSASFSAGSYPIVVENQNGTSNAVSFDVTQ